MNNNNHFFKPINNSSVVQQVIDRLTEAMIQKEFRPGEKIPTEIELAESFGIGRNSIREAIKILVYMGVLEIRRAEGTFVCQGFSESMIDPMIYGIILDTSESYEYLKELRELMDIGVMKLAIKKSTERDLKKLWQFYKNMEEAITNTPEDVDKVFETDNIFHTAISDMANNQVLSKIESVVHTLTYSMRLKTVKNMLENGEGKELLKVHYDIYNVLKDKDESDIESVIKKSYFYEKNILD